MNARRIDGTVVGFSLVVLLAISVGLIARAGRHGAGMHINPVLGEGVHFNPVAGATFTMVPRTTTRGIPLASGHAKSVTWTFLVESAADLPHGPTRLSGPCLGIETERPDSFRGESSSCVDQPPPVALELRYLDGDPSTILVYGMTSAPAASFRIDGRAGPPVLTDALSTKTFPGFRFYAIQLPVESLPERFSERLVVTALAADGTPLLRSTPLPGTPPPPPPSPPAPLGPPPGRDCEGGVPQGSKPCTFPCVTQGMTSTGRCLYDPTRPSPTTTSSYPPPPTTTPGPCSPAVPPPAAT